MASSDPNKEDLINAVKGGDPARTRAALDRGACPNTPYGQDGWPVLVQAVMKPRLTASELEVVNVLLGHPRVDVNKRDGGGWTALMGAEINGNTDACILLLKAGADTTITDCLGRTAIWWAAARGHRQAIEAIVSCGGDPKKTDKYGVSPAELARHNGHKSLADWLDHQEQRPRRVGQDVPVDEYSTYVYPNTRGKVVYFNCINYTKSKIRRGADKDARNVEETFELLGYSFVYHEDKTVAEMENELEAIAKNPDLNYIDSLIIVIGSHGGERTMFVGADEEKYDITWVKDHFSDESCPAMKNKPKVLICNFCRGSYAEDAFVPAAGRKHVHEVTVRGEVKRALHGIYHMVILFPCSEDISAKRNTISGSYFLSALCETLRHNQEDIVDVIMDKTAKALVDQGKPSPQLVKEPPFHKFIFKVKPQTK